MILTIYFFYFGCVDAFMYRIRFGKKGNQTEISLPEPGHVLKSKALPSSLWWLYCCTSSWATKQGPFDLFKCVGLVYGNLQLMFCIPNLNKCVTLYSCKSRSQPIQHSLPLELWGPARSTALFYPHPQRPYWLGALQEVLSTHWWLLGWCILGWTKKVSGWSIIFVESEYPLWFDLPTSI